MEKRRYISSKFDEESLRYYGSVEEWIQEFEKEYGCKLVTVWHDMFIFILE